MRTNRTAESWILAVIVLLAAAAPVAGQQQVVPSPPVPVTSLPVTVNNGPGEQTDPHVSGDVVSYTDGVTPTPAAIRYYRFSAGAGAAVAGADSLNDLLSDVNGDRIAFTRIMADRSAIFVFDTAASTLTEIAPHGGSNHIGSAIGGNTVAYVDFGTGAGVIFAHDLSSPGFGTVQLSSGAGSSQNPAVAPSGHVVVWEQCFSVIACDVMASVFKPDQNAWSGFFVAAGATNPDSDGTWIVYDANRAGSLTGLDIYFKPVAGDGIERQLAISGVQVNPSISQGVIAFESRETASSPGDVFVYVLATNKLYQVTSTPLTDEQLTDVSVLPNGDIRVVWAANDGLQGDYNIYATTFTPAATPTDLIQRLIQQVMGLNLRQGITNSLDVKLDAALQALDDMNQNNNVAAINALRAFINAVEAQRGVSISDADADALIAAAQQIIASLGG